MTQPTNKRTQQKNQAQQKRSVSVGQLRRQAAQKKQTANTELPSMDTAQLHARLHALTAKKGDEETIRNLFRQLVMEHTRAVGVGHIVLDEDGKWVLTPEFTSGRIPQRADFLEKFSSCCTATIQRNSIQIENFLGLQSVYAPISVSGGRPEVLLVLVEERNARKALFSLEIITAYFSLWLRESQSDRSGWKLNSLAALIELVTQIEGQQDVTKACQVVAAELSRHLGCEQVAVGFLHKGELSVRAVTGNADLSQQSTTLQSFETALNECLLRDEPGIWPCAADQDPNKQHLMLAHRQLTQQFQCEAVLSTPLKNLDGTPIGALVLTGAKEMIHGDRLPNFVQAAAPRIASSIDVVRRTETSRFRKLINALKQQASTVKGRIWCGLVAVLMGIMLVPVPYRVRCNCSTETTQRRYAVAPFEGLVKRAFAQPGDLVERGQRLAEMDGQSIRFELAGIVAEINQAGKKREIELSSRNVPESMLADLESQRLVARRQELEFQKQQIDIRSPFTGIVLAGSMERAEGASVQQGEVLFEMAPLKSLKIEIAIPSEEIAHVEVGQNTRVWIEGLESQSIVGRVDRIHPQSVLRDARNVFIAEVTVENPDDRLRPGMQGRARIDCNSKTLGWTLFHKPWHYIASRLTWW